MNVLVAVASKHGATHGIADAIAEELTRLGIGAHVRNLAVSPDLTGFDAVIIGSAIYMGHVMSPAIDFVDRHAFALSGMPVWLFTSGQLGYESVVPAKESDDLTDLADRIGARGRIGFTGRLASDDLSIGERIVTKAVHAPEGDFRDWQAIRAWAQDIAASLVPLDAAVAAET